LSYNLAFAERRFQTRAVEVFIEDQTTERAIDDLLENLDKKAFKNITYRQSDTEAPEEARTSNSTIHTNVRP
jgi:hypothetical protein